MEIKNNKHPVEGSQPRRFSAGRTAAKPGANAFAAALKKAASVSEAASASETALGAETATAGAPALSDAALAFPEASPLSENATAPQPATNQTSGADSDAAFADHMDLVRFRLKTGYYASKAINDALTDKLSGYFDELT